MPRVGVSLILQSTGLNAASPWKRSMEREKKSRVIKLFGLPKKFPEYGRAVLSKGDVWVGTMRPSKSRLDIAVMSRNVCCPMIGIIRLEDVLVVRVKYSTEHVGVIVGEWVPLAVPVPVGESQPPAILDRDEMTRLLRLGGKDTR